MSRLNELIQSTPLATLAILGLNVSIYICQILLDPQLNHYTLVPYLVLYRGQVYRLVTSTLLHGSLMHIAMNGMSLLGLGSALEKHVMGTTPLFLMTLGSIFATPSVHVLLAWMAHLVGYSNWFHQNSVGFSGVLFHWSVLESRRSNEPRSVFGFVRVPAHLYPWALLVILQLFMPNLSFLGHLSGIIVGTAQVYSGYTPQSSLVERRLSSLQTFVPTVEGFSLGGRGESSSTPSLRHACGALGTYAGWILETIKVIIFGRGQRANANVQLVGNTDDDDEWNGLPTVMEVDDEDQSKSFVSESQMV